MLAKKSSEVWSPKAEDNDELRSCSAMNDASKAYTVYCRPDASLQARGKPSLLQAIYLAGLELIFQFFATILNRAE